MAAQGHEGARRGGGLVVPPPTACPAAIDSGALTAATMRAQGSLSTRLRGHVRQAASSCPSVPSLYVVAAGKEHIDLSGLAPYHF